MQASYKSTLREIQIKLNELLHNNINTGNELIKKNNLNLINSLIRQYRPFFVTESITKDRHSLLSEIRLVRSSSKDLKKSNV